MEWLTESVRPAVVAVVQLLVVVAATEIARLARKRAAALERELDGLRPEKSSTGSSLSTPE